MEALRRGEIDLTVSTREDATLDGSSTTRAEIKAVWKKMQLIARRANPTKNGASRQVGLCS